jgi:uncharacterized protein (TIGR02444 family)
VTAERVEAPDEQSAPADRFWRFSLALYGRPGVADACVALQDRDGLDVNVVLWCCWHASEGRALDIAELAAADAQVAPWRTGVVEPLRAVRRRLKLTRPGPVDEGREALRQQVKSAELEAEKHEQAALTAAAVGAPVSEPPTAVAWRNLEAYLASRGAQPGSASREELAVIVVACASLTR